MRILDFYIARLLITALLILLSPKAPLLASVLLSNFTNNLRVINAHS